MNDRMRRYLDEDWDETGEPEEHEREDRKSTNVVKQQRRQESKEWGRAIAKYHRDRKKNGLTNGKP